MTETRVTETRDRLAIALDTSDLESAVALAKQVTPYIGTAKIGLQLYSAVGPDAVRAMRDLGLNVFIDLKLHDIPATVKGAATVLGALGATYVTVHASGGTAMLQAAVEGLAEGANTAGLAAPTVLAVTVLTSDPTASEELLRERLGFALAAGCGGIVCAATDLPTIRAASADIITMVPGIRPAGVALNDQKRVATPAEAIRAGASVLVIGRAVTHADDPASAAARIAEEVASAV